MSLGKRCYYCFNEAIHIRHGTPRCLDHTPSFAEKPVTENKEKIEEAPVTPKLPGMFDGWMP